MALLMPDHIDLSTITDPKYLHRLLSEDSFLQQCIEKGVKVVFGLAQISGLIDKLFWSVRYLPGTHPLYRRRGKSEKSRNSKFQFF